MACLLPEILGETFRYLQTSQDSTLDLAAASLVCTAWYCEARPLLENGALRRLILQNSNIDTAYDDIWCKEYLQRLFSLLVESRRLGLDLCDLVEEIFFNLYYVTEEALENVDVISSILSLALPNLRGIHARLTNPRSSLEFQRKVVNIFDRLCPLACTITTVVIIGPQRHPSWDTNHKAIVHLITLLGGTLRDVFLFDVLLNEPMQLALTQCSRIERLSTRHIFFPLLSNLHRTLIRLASALPNLASLNFLTANGEDGTPASAVRMLVTLQPGLKSLRLRVDASVDDDCLRFLAEKAQELTDLYLERCKGIRGTGTWMEENIKWHGLRRLHIVGAMGISKSMVAQLLRGCGMLESVHLAGHSGFEGLMAEYGFKCKKDNIWEHSVG